MPCSGPCRCLCLSRARPRNATGCGAVPCRETGVHRSEAGASDHYGGRVSRFVVDITPLKKYRHFRRLWAGQMVSGLGSQLTLVAVSFQAYALTHSTLVVGLIGLAQLVPLLAGALWGGTLADAMDRRKVLILTQVAMATAVGGLVVNASLSHPV